MSVFDNNFENFRAEINWPSEPEVRDIDPSIMQGLGLKEEDVEEYWDRKNSVLTEAFENGSKAYELFRTPNTSVDSLKLGEYITIKLDAPAHNPEDLVQQAAELYGSREHQADQDRIRPYIQALGLGALKDKKYELTVKAFNVLAGGKLDQYTNLLKMLGEKIMLTFPQEREAKDELVQLGLVIQKAKQPAQSPTPTTTPQETSEPQPPTISPLRPAPLRFGGRLPAGDQDI